MTQSLDSRGRAVRVGDAVFRTPGLEGTVKTYKPAAPGTRAKRGLAPETMTAMEEEGLRVLNVYEIDKAREVSLPTGAKTRSTGYGEPAIEFTVPGVSKGWGQVVLYTDESGMVSWHYPEPQPSPAPGEKTVRGAKAANTYIIRRTVSHVPKDKTGTAKSRGILGSLGKKVLQVLGFKLIDKIVGEIGPRFVRQWEEKYRAHRFRPFGPGKVEIGKEESLGNNDWPHLLKDRALLLIHGTFSTTEAAFSQLPEDFLNRLDQKYRGRVFAFDHPTMSNAPEENLAWFVRNIPDGSKLDLDIITHSRGGLLGRLISEKLDQIRVDNEKLNLGSRRIKVNRMVMVAPPNGGTILTDMKHMKTFVDCYSNLLSLLPPNLVTTIFKAIIAVVKHLAANIVAGLEGLQAMAPDGGFLKFLNTPTPPLSPDTKYFAMASDFEPVKLGVKTAFDALLDQIFGIRNDLVVPTAGVYEDNGATLFPIRERVVYSETEGVTHTGFFGKEETRRQLLKWLE